MSRVLRWQQDSSQPDLLRRVLEDAGRDGPSERELEQLIAGVQGSLARAPVARDSAPDVFARLRVPILVFVTAFGVTSFVRSLRPSSHEGSSRSHVSAPPSTDSEPPIFEPGPESPEAVPASAVILQPRAERPGTSPRNARLPSETTPSAAPNPARAKGVAALPRAPSPAAAASETYVLDEARLLQAAKRALPHSPALAAERLAEHRRTFGDGVLVEERDALEIETSWAQGLKAQAARRAQRFQMRYPHSNYLRRIEDLLAGTPSGE